MESRAPAPLIGSWVSRCVAALLSEEPRSVTIVFPSADITLRLSEQVDSAGRYRSDPATQRRVLDIGAAMILELAEDPGLAMAMYPMRDASALLEVVASHEAIVRRSEGLQAIVDAAAMLLDQTDAFGRQQDLDLAIAITAHELRGPLLAARAAISQVEKGDARDAREILRRVGHELEKLADLADGLLSWAAGATPLRRDAVDLARVVRDAAASSVFEAGTDRVILRSPRSLIVFGDLRSLRTAITNLIRNALDYSPPDTSVEVIVDTREDDATIDVKDRGPGIPASERARIFEPFSRGESGDRVRNGRGLGLYVAKKIAQAHGGEIWVEPSDGGTLLRVRIPVATTERRQTSTKIDAQELRNRRNSPIGNVTLPADPRNGGVLGRLSANSSIGTIGNKQSPLHEGPRIVILRAGWPYRTQ